MWTLIRKAPGFFATTDFLTCTHRRKYKNRKKSLPPGKAAKLLILSILRQQCMFNIFDKCLQRDAMRILIYALINVQKLDFRVFIRILPQNM